MSHSPFYEELEIDAREASAHGDVVEEQHIVEVEYECDEISKEERDELLEILAYTPC